MSLIRDFISSGKSLQLESGNVKLEIHQSQICYHFPIIIKLWPVDVHSDLSLGTVIKLHWKYVFQVNSKILYYRKIK